VCLQTRTLGRILLEVGEPARAPRAYRGVTSGGDERRLRGLPAIAKGVSGAVRGSNPTDCIVRINQERGERQAPHVRPCGAGSAAASSRWPRGTSPAPAAGRAPVCESCRHPPPPVTAEARAWWVERFGRDELQRMAAAIWPER
jgi:hypothetical protein